MTYTSKIVHSPTGISLNQKNRRYNDDGKIIGKSEHAINSYKSIDKSVNTVKPSVKEHVSRKNIGVLNNSLDNSPGKLMKTFKDEQKSPKFSKNDADLIKSEVASSKTFDFSDKSNVIDY